MQQRALAPDLARGMMLLFIAIANVSAYLWGQSTPIYTLHPEDGSALDRALSAITIVFVDARVYPMFAFLFGYGMVQFASSRHRRGVPHASIRGMLWRRHWWLLAFGFAHAALLFAGDVLGAYGLTGLLLTAVLFWGSDRAIKITIWIMGGVFALGALLLLAGAIVFAMLVPLDTQAGLMSTAMSDEFGTNADIMSGIPNYGLAMLARIGLWLVATPATVLALLVPICVMLGWLAARHGWLEGAVTRFSLGSVAFWGILIGSVGALPPALSYLGLLPSFEHSSWGFMLLSQLAGVAGGIGYAALFGWLGLRLRDRGLPRAIAAIGRRSLSFYLLQSVVFAPLLAAWGFGLGSRIGTAQAFGIAVAVWLLSLALAALLDRRGVRGPAEVLLRRLTYARLDSVPTQSTAAPPADPQVK